MLLRQSHIYYNEILFHQILSKGHYIQATVYCLYCMDLLCEDMTLTHHLSVPQNNVLILNYLLLLLLKHMVLYLYQVIYA